MIFGPNEQMTFQSSASVAGGSVQQPLRARAGHVHHRRVGDDLLQDRCYGLYLHRRIHARRFLGAFQFFRQSEFLIAEAVLESMTQLQRR